MQIRLWKLGDMKSQIFPTQQAIDNLLNNLKEAYSNGGGDIIWGPELNVKTIKCDNCDINIIGADNIELIKIDNRTIQVKQKV